MNYPIPVKVTGQDIKDQYDLDSDYGKLIDSAKRNEYDHVLEIEDNDGVRHIDVADQEVEQVPYGVLSSRIVFQYKTLDGTPRKFLRVSDYDKMPMWYYGEGGRAGRVQDQDFRQELENAFQSMR